MAKAGFQFAAKVSDVPEGRARKVVVGDQEIALCHVNNRFFAISNVCAHQHFSALHLGLIEGETLTCPMHGWTYSLETGVAVTGEGRVRVFAIEVEGGRIYVETPESS